MLKREIWESGYSSIYNMEGEFRFDAENKLSNLPASIFEELRKEQMRRTNSVEPLNDNQLINEYTALILEEIVKRATFAAYRTVNW